jgi:hypothetical protein
MSSLSTCECMSYEEPKVKCGRNGYGWTYVKPPVVISMTHARCEIRRNYAIEELFDVSKMTHARATRGSLVLNLILLEKSSRAIIVFEFISG